MCGINGILGISDLEKADCLIQKMNNALSHRGPDDAGLYLKEGIALGHRRLSIIDLSAAGHQPMQDARQRYTIVYNGELYNYREVKKSIQAENPSFQFRTKTDTEVLLGAFDTWKYDCLSKLNGMFAFAIWDDEIQTLFIARDRLGIKPLYYCFSKGQFAFSSEIRSLLVSNIVPRTLDKNSLVDYLRYLTVNAPNTMVKDVYMLHPGHYMVLKKSLPLQAPQIKKYWSLKSHSSLEIYDTNNYEEICKNIHQLMTASVKRRLIADVPFGAFLSGGVDSSIVVGLMSQVSSIPVKTFSIGFKEEKFNEAKYARIIAEKFRTDHTEIILGEADFRRELPGALKAMDHPSGDAINTYVVSKYTKQAGITMALSGLGGDELFAGYSIFNRSIALREKKLLRALPQFVRQNLGHLVKTFSNSISSSKIAAVLSLTDLSFRSYYPLSRQVLLDPEISRLMRIEKLPLNSVSCILEQEIAEGPEFLLSEVSQAEILTYMQNILLRDTDQMSMAHALEVRVPFLDYTLVEYVLSIPDVHKHLQTPKKLLTDTFKGMLPDEVVNRPKMGFLLPWDNWLKNDLREFCHPLIQSLANRGIFDKKEVLALWSQFLKGDKKVTWARVWYLVVLEHWLLENGIND